MSWLRKWWALTAPTPMTTTGDTALLDEVAPRTPRDWWVDAGVFMVATVLGAIILDVTGDVTAHPMTSGQVAVDATLGALCCLSLWWRRRWPFGVALLCVLVGAFSTSGTVAALVALSSLATHRHIRPALLIAALFLPSAVVCSVWLGRDDTASVLLPTAALAAAAVAWGMYVRARHQLARTERARLAERTRIAREMHDVLAHRISLVALHAGALEVARDLPPAQVRESAALLRSTAQRALEELRDVIGVLRDEAGREQASTVPQPTLADIPRLVEETRRSGARIDFDMQVDDVDAAPGPLGRDAYRIVQEALTNVSKHAGGALAQVRVVGSPRHGLHVCVRNPAAVGAHTAPPGSGTGLLGLQERVTLANGVLVHGRDESGDFVVEADLPW